MDFCNAFNDKTKEMEKGLKVPVEITVFEDRTFTFITKSPPAAVLLKKAAGIDSGSGEPNRTKVAKIPVSKVQEIAQMLELTSTLNNRASGLTADGKQKISLGRGLVRSDVNVIMFDEPLTVIDPHLKWVLRSKLKELHQKINRTMIYVTHDQTEALTFADQVVVMHEGQIVQTGTPVELFEKPKHTFVGHFIGSPGMNILPCEINKGAVAVNGTKIETSNSKIDNSNFSKMEVGVRPEFISFNKEGLPVKILNVSNTGKNKIIETESDSGKIKLITKASEKIPEGSAFLTFKKEYTYVYGDNWIVD